MSKGSPFSRRTMFGVLAAGFATFLAMLYFIGAGDTGERGNNGSAHAAATGLNGYAGLVRLLEAEDYDVTLSRSPAGLETDDLLILMPERFTDAEALGQILKNREYVGPTLVILPKWGASPPPPGTDQEVAEKFEDGWVTLYDASAHGWPAELPLPYRLEQQVETLEDGNVAEWSGFNLQGRLPTKSITFSKDSDIHGPIITDDADHTLAFQVIGEEGTEYYNEAHWTTFVVEPDLVNNYGLADERRARAALALVDEAGYGEATSITFDMTLNGYGGAMNLLTLAFQPPFLAATLCLLLAMLIIGWRAFLRFGPAVASQSDIAFGKNRLVRNGAGLIVRAKRLGLLAKPYADLSMRRIARVLGIARPDADAIDEAIAARLPQEEPFSVRAARLQNADTPTEIVRAAQALRELEGKLAK